jgi:glutathione S-transferase
MSMSELTIIGAPQSSFVRTTRMALEEKGVAYTLVPVVPQSPEAKAIHPFGKIPVMRHDDFTLFESRAIIAYADRAFPGPRLIPDDARRAAIIEQWASAVSACAFPMIFPYLRENFFPTGGKTDRAQIEAQLPNVRQAIAILDRAAHAGHLAGEEFSIADMYAMPLLAYLRVLAESRDMLAESKSLPAYFEKHSQRSSFKNTIPPQFPGH